MAYIHYLEDEFASLTLHKYNNFIPWTQPNKIVSIRKIQIIIRTTDENLYSQEKVVMEWIDQNNSEQVRDEILRL